MITTGGATLYQKLKLNKHTLCFLIRLLLSGQRKHTLRWLRSQRSNYLLDAPSPWLTFDAIDFISHRLNKGSRVFEYGSGGSTLFWMSAGAQCVSIEHDPEWFTVVRDHLNRLERILPLQRIGSTVNAVDYRLIEPECASDIVVDTADPTCYLSDDPAYRGYTFRNYASQIDSFPDNTFDVVLIDGRARPSCIMHSAPKVKVGGVLILDNADRAYYTEKTGPHLRHFSRLEFSGAVPVNAAFSRTDIYLRKRTEDVSLA